MKRILLIMPFYYKYHKKIKSAMEKMGYKVTLCNERPATVIWEVLHFLSKKGFNTRKIMNIYHDSIIKKATKNGSFDYFIVIRGEEITEELIRHIKTNHIKNGGKTIYYAWDAFINFKKSFELFLLFDESFTFDSNDFKEHKNLKFLPLFFFNEYKKSENYIEKNKKYDICAIATYHTKRYEITKTFYRMKDIKLFSHIFISIDFYAKLRIIDRIAKLSKKIVRFYKLTHKKIIKVYNQSAAVLDVPSPNQSGLTIRTLECLAMQKKLITTNRDIKNYDFYHADNIYIIDENNPSYPDKAWLDLPYKKIPENIVTKYSITQWIKNLLKN